MLQSLSVALRRRKPIAEILRSHASSSRKDKLKKCLGPFDLILYGVGSSIGAGIYSLIGLGAQEAGPGVALSFAICGISCIFTSLCYSEFSSRVPVAGSAYTFVYASFGEFAAWLIGWNLTLGYGVSSAVVARSWAEYVVSFLKDCGYSIPDWLTHAKILGCDSNVLSVVLIFLCTLVLCFGVKESTKFNAVMTVLNLIVLTFVVIVGTPQVRDENLEDFTPNGLSGVAKGAGLVFFAFLGFDMVSCLSEEVENPQRNMPIGIIGSLVISMIVYVSLSLVICGMADIDLLGTETPISNAFTANACCTPDQQEKDITKACLDCNGGEAINSTLFYGSKIIQFGAMFGLTTACFTCLMGQPRIFYRMAKDGLLFSHFGKINKSNSVPLFGTIFTGFFVSAIAVFIDLEKLAKMISLGTLQVFTFVNAGVIILRTSRPDVNKHYVPSLLVIFVLFVFAGGISVEYWTFCGVWQTSIPTACLIGSGLVAMLIRKAPRANPPNSFKCPMVPIVPLAGVFCNVYMCASMGQKAWEDIGYWLAVGCFIYFTYGMWNSELREKNDILFTNSLDSGYGSRDGESESSSAPLINEDVYRFSGKKKGIII